MLFAPVTPDEKEDISTKLLKLDQTKMIYFGKTITKQKKHKYSIVIKNKLQLFVKTYFYHIFLKTSLKPIFLFGNIRIW